MERDGSEAAPGPGPAASRHTWLVALVCGAAFTLAYGHAPLYYSNQNQYLLHGFAWAEQGHLADDWLANTLDPTPVFSGLVAVTVGSLDPRLFHVYHGLLQAAYAAALVFGFVALAGPRATPARQWLFAALLVLLHSAALRALSYRWLGQDYPWYFQAGVAGQYVLGAMFQPSVFGVLLIVAVALFLWERPAAAAVCLALAATVHATYLLPAALLALGMATNLAADGRRRGAVLLVAAVAMLCLPSALVGALTFGPTSPEEFARAQDLLVNVRIPHHARPDLWLDPVAGVQIGWMVLGTALAWRTRLFAVMAVPLALGAALTGLQVATGNNTLALLFPWRISSVLVPLATAVVLTRLVAVLPLPARAGSTVAAAGLTLAVLAGAGLAVNQLRLAFASSDEELAVMHFVREHQHKGDVYFLPVRVPDLAGTVRGSFSSDFKPVPEKLSDSRVIPLDLQRFRLHAEAPIYVDFKAIPYKDVEVMEWAERLRAAEEIQELLKKGDTAGASDRLRLRGVNHVVWPSAQRLTGPGWSAVYRDDYYTVYHLD
jgi:hypothetical protein